MSTWGVDSIQGRLPDGTHTTADDRRAKAWFVRRRVDGTARRRTFKQKGHAKTFQDKLNNERPGGHPEPLGLHCSPPHLNA